MIASSVSITDSFGLTFLILGLFVRPSGASLVSLATKSACEWGRDR